MGACVRAWAWARVRAKGERRKVASTFEIEHGDGHVGLERLGKGCASSLLDTVPCVVDVAMTPGREAWTHGRAHKHSPLPHATVSGFVHEWTWARVRANGERRKGVYTFEIEHGDRRVGLERFGKGRAPSRPDTIGCGPQWLEVP